MGHRKLAGRVTLESPFGAAMLRVDVPAVCGSPGFTTYLSPSAIFSCTPVSELVAKAQAEAIHARPVMVYRSDVQMGLPAPDDSWVEEEDDDE